MNAEDHLGLVNYVVKKMRRWYPRESYEDLFQAGCVGLMNAVKSYDASRGYKFATFAVVWIRGSIQRELRDNQPIHVSRGDKELYQRIVLDDRDDASPEEIAARYGCPVAQAKRAKQVAQLQIGALDSPITTDATITLLDTLPDYSDFSAAFVADFIRSLPEQRRAVLRLRMQGYHQHEIGRRLGITQVQVSRLLRRIGQQYLDTQGGIA